MSVIYKERERDTESRGGGRSYTVKRYRVPDRVVEEDRTEVRITRREGEGRDRDVREKDVREYRFEREVERQPPARPRYREVSPPEREWVVEREILREPPRRDYELERYSRTTDYYSRPEAPQPIIIRQEAPRPIIIREREPTQEIVLREERRPEPKYEMVERARSEERQVAKREEPRDDEEDYYYQRTTRQVARRADSYEEEDRYRRDVGPRDSVSQYARSEYSGDEYYYRRTDEYDDYEGGRDKSPDHRRHLAEGAVAGLGAAALLRHHKKAQGEKAGGLGQLVGGAALGTIGAELITRARNQYSDKRSRSRGRDYRGGRGEERSRSRSEPGNLAKLGAVAAIGAVAAYALTRNKNKDVAKQKTRRSRSRRRRGSTSRARSISSDANDSKHKNSVIAKAGLATAAVAGLVERARSKSRGRDAPERSNIKIGAPIVAAGLGGAALAGLYESNKSKNQAKKSKNRSARDSSSESPRSRSRSRGKSRSRSAASLNYQDPAAVGLASGAVAGPLVEYGGAPIPADDIYARPRSRANSYYSDAGARSGHRHGSPGSSNSGSPPPRRARLKERSQSRGRDSVTAAAAGAAAAEADQRRERRRAQRERRRQEEEGGDTPNGGPYAFGPYAQAPPPAPPVQQYSMPQEQQPYQAYYPQTNNFPPPPPQTYYTDPIPTYTGAQNTYTPYTPPPVTTNYQTQPDVAAAASIPGDPYFLNHPQQHDLTRHPGAFEHDDHGDRNDRNDRNDRRRANNVSDAPSVAPSQNKDADNIDNTALVTRTPALKRLKSVQFDLPSPDVERFYSRTDRNRSIPTHNEDDQATDETSSPERQRKPERNSEQSKLRKKRRPDGGRPRASSMDDKSSGSARSRGDLRPRHRSASPPSVNSDDTIVMPDRFDRQGRKLPERGDDPLADKIQDILNGQGTVGKFFQRFTGDFLLGGGGGGGGGRGRR